MPFHPIWRARGRTGPDRIAARLGWRGGLHPGLLLLVALGLVVGACAKPNTVLLVTVEDDSGKLTTITQLKVLITVGDAKSEFNAPETGRLPLKFPTTLTVEMDRSLTGVVNVRVDAINASIQTLASASMTLPDLNVGHTNPITLHLGPTPPDGGVDGGIDAHDGSSDVGPGDAPADSRGDLGPDGPGNDTAPGAGGMSGTGGTSDTGGSTGAGGMGTGGLGMGGMGGMGAGGTGVGGMGVGGTGVGGTGVGGMGVGGMGVGGDLGVGGDTGAGGDVDAGDDADPDVPVD